MLKRDTEDDRKAGRSCDPESSILTMAGFGVCLERAWPMRQPAPCCRGNAVADGAAIAHRAGSGRNLSGGHRRRRDGAGLWRELVGVRQRACYAVIATGAIVGAAR